VTGSAAAIVEVVVCSIITPVDTRWPSAARADAAVEAAPRSVCLIPRPSSKHGLVSKVLGCEWLVARVDGSDTGILVLCLALTLLLGLHLTLCFAGSPGKSQVDLLSKAHLLRSLLFVVVAVVLIGTVAESSPAAPPCAPGEGSGEEGLSSWGERREATRGGLVACVGVRCEASVCVPDSRSGRDGLAQSAAESITDCHCEGGCGCA
jgi:hypothetical protein